MTTDLARQDRITPERFTEQISWAHEKAAQLRKVVDEQRLSVKIGPSEHLRVEAWQTIAKGYGCSASSEVTELHKDKDGKVIGVTARSKVIDNGSGIVVGGADSFCFADEEGKGDQSVAQLAGMAQTRSISRGLKQVFSWVVVLAGYDPTPAEELHGAGANPKVVDAALLCPLHKVECFKRGQMRDYAHPIGDTGKWCNLRDAQKTFAATQKADVPKDAGDIFPPEPAQGAPTEQQGPAVAIPKSMVELWNMGLKLGYKNKAVMLLTIGVKDDALIGDLGEAWAKLLAGSERTATATATAGKS